MTAEDIIARLDAVRPSGRGWTARCPAHDDRRSSLSVGVGDGGRVLLRCHAGCNLDAILAALGLERSDVAPTRSERQAPRIVAEYDYRDEGGALLYQAVRYAPKDFRQRAPDDSGGWKWKLGGVRRVPYRLPELLASTGPVFCVEGEKDADALTRIGLIATTNAGGAGVDWPTEWAKHFSGRDVYVLPDNDEPGKKHAAQVAAVLRRSAASVRIVALPGLPPKGDVSDWLVAGGTAGELLALAGAAPSASLAAALGTERDGWEPPVPLGMTTDIPPFPVDVLPRWLSDHVAAVSAFAQTPTDLAGLTALAVLSACARGRYDIECPPGHREPLALYTAVALPPGERKTSVHAAMTRPLAEWERDQAILEAPNVTERTAERKMLEKRIEHLQGRAAKEDRPDERRSIMHDAIGACSERDALPEIVPTTILVDDCTPEALITALAEQGGRLAMLSAEGGVFDVVAGLYNDSKSNLDGLLKAHDAEPIRVRRQSRAPVHVDRPILTIGLAVQPSVIEALGGNARFRGRGLLARFLYAIPASSLGRRLASPPPVPGGVAAEYSRRVRGLLDAVPADVLPIRLDADALKFWRDFVVALEPRLHPDTGDLAGIGDWAGKLPGAIARIAGLLHLADRPASEPVSDRTILAAITIGEYLTSHAIAAFGLMGEDAGLVAARCALRWIEQHEIEAFTAREIFNGVRGRSCLKDMDAIRRALGRLEDHGYVRPAGFADSADSALKGPFQAFSSPSSTNRSNRSRPGRPASPRFVVSPFLRQPLAHNPHNPQNPLCEAHHGGA